jgi:aminopeptidase-like protein
LPVGRLTRSPNGEYPEYLSPKGEPQLGKRGLYGSVGGVPPGDFRQALLWVLNYCDGEHDLLSIAERSGLGFARIAQAAAALEAAGLVREIDAAGLVRPIDQVGRGELQ